MSELNQTMKGLSASVHPMTSKCDTQLTLDQLNSHDAIGRAQALATDLVTDFELDQGDSSLFIGQTGLQILRPSLEDFRRIAGASSRIPKGIGNTKPLANVLSIVKAPGRRGCSPGSCISNHHERSLRRVGTLTRCDCQ